MAIQNPQRKVLLAGASGLVGRKILQLLTNDSSVAQVHLLSRRPLALQHPKVQVHLVDFGSLPELPKVDEVYLAIGTTIKTAGSQAAFRAVDLDTNLAVAHTAKLAGARRLGLVSAAGADEHSSIFYNKVKGELEQALKQLQFETLVIAQPSLLLDSRTGLGQPTRVGERFAIPLAKLLAPFLPATYKPVYAQAVAKVITQTTPNSTGTVILNSGQLVEIGKES